MSAFSHLSPAYNDTLPYGLYSTPLNQMLRRLCNVTVDGCPLLTGVASTSSLFSPSCSVIFCVGRAIFFSQHWADLILDLRDEDLGEHNACNLTETRTHSGCVPNSTLFPTQCTSFVPSPVCGIGSHLGRRLGANSLPTPPLLDKA